ncbi:DUF4233 domain-containing protein [Amnibacterium endophyticum]|uniref:DUF4233 domain-containing protein n=1 Tax=Amnibacterium endophyticum TaxID=2109337 RepID=A0ABW4LGF9_9MICO
MSDRPGRPGRPRRPRSVTASLAQIVLAFEFVVVALSTLVVFGLRALPAGLSLVGGGVLLVLIVIAAGLATRRAGIALGWAVQVLFVAGVVLNLGVGIVGLIFGALWTYSMIVGGRIDRRNAAA